MHIRLRAKRLPFIAFLLVIAILIYPRFSQAATSSVRVDQPSTVPNTPSVTGTRGDRFTPSNTAVPQISNVTVTVTDNSVTVAWRTNEPTLSRLSWGAGPDYEAGTLAGTKYSAIHDLEVSPLAAENTYYFIISAISQTGNQVNYRGVFTTLAPVDRSPPQSVSRLTASPQSQIIRLAWQNPPDKDFSLTRVVRSDKFFPLDWLNGQVVYEGIAQIFNDENVSPGNMYYYSVFTRDHAGNYSSAAVAQAMIAWYSEASESGIPAIDFSFVKAPISATHPLALQDITVTTNQGATHFNSSQIIASAGQPLRIAVPADVTPPGTAAIIATVHAQDTPGGIATYLFRYQKDIRSYVLDLPTMAFNGPYSLIINTFDSTQRVIDQVALPFFINSAGATDRDTEPSARPPLIQRALYAGLIIVGVASGGIWLRRRAHDGR